MGKWHKETTEGERIGFMALRLRGCANREYAVCMVQSTVCRVCKIACKVDCSRNEALLSC